MSLFLDRSDAPARLRGALAAEVERLAGAGADLRVAPAGELRGAGEGHFHLAPELFLQLSGTTRFRFPEAVVALAPGQALLLPPRLLHAERVRAGGPREPFCNLVVYAEGDRLSCHLAHEAEPGRPGIWHLEARRHPQAARVHDWLADAARLAPHGTADRAADVQVRSLVAAAAAGVLRALDEPDREAVAEPALIARLRVVVQNRLGDPALGVRELAERSGCTPDYLSSLFSRHAGEHLVAYITRLRLERAARLLRETPMAVKEVAWACGYASPGYFIRCFRARHGVTPRAWRRQAGAAPA